MRGIAMRRALIALALAAATGVAACGEEKEEEPAGRTGGGT
jgi:hypothetical protein